MESLFAATSLPYFFCLLPLPFQHWLPGGREGRRGTRRGGFRVVDNLLDFFELFFSRIQLFFQCIQDCVGIGGFGHGLGFGVVAVPNTRNVPAQFFHQGNDFGNLLLGQQIELQVKLSAALGETRLAVLRDQDNYCQQQAAGRDQPGEKWKRRRVERGEIGVIGRDIQKDPSSNRGNDDTQKQRASEKRRDALNQPLMGTDIAFAPRMKRGNRLNMLADMIRQSTFTQLIGLCHDYFGPSTKWSMMLPSGRITVMVTREPATSHLIA